MFEDLVIVGAFFAALSAFFGYLADAIKSLL
jgi:hypothetical protein